MIITEIETSQVIKVPFQRPMKQAELILTSVIRMVLQKWTFLNWICIEYYLLNKEVSISCLRREA